jgi:hypothetical protein
VSRYHLLKPIKSMQKNHLFPTILVTLSVALISFAAPARNGSVPTYKAETEVVATPAATSAASKGYASLYEGLNLDSKGLSKEAFDYALKGYEKLVAEGAVTRDQYLTIVDFSQSGRKKRFYLIDVKNGELLINTFVSHGKNSGLDMAQKFSNKPNSEQSSLGFYITSATYTGKHGLSLRLQGQEEGFNDNAMARGIVVHGAAYVNSGRVNSDFMGRSQGCPALPENEYAKVINLIKDGSVMFLYHPSQEYIQNSPLLNS